MINTNNLPRTTAHQLNETGPALAKSASLLSLRMPTALMAVTAALSLNAADPTLFPEERTNIDHLSNKGLWQEVGGVLSFIAANTNESAIAWIPVNLKPGEKVGHVGYIAGKIAADGTTNLVSSASWRYEVYGPINEISKGGLHVINSPAATLAGPINADFNKPVGSVAKIPIMRYDFDLNHLNLTAPPAGPSTTTSTNGMLCWVAVVARSNDPQADVSFTAFSSGELQFSPFGDAPNVFVRGPGFDRGSLPMRLVDHPEYSGTANFACYSTTSQLPPQINYSLNAGDLTLTWPAEQGYRLQSRDALDNSSWANVVGVPAEESSYSVSNVAGAGTKKFYRVLK